MRFRNDSDGRFSRINFLRGEIRGLFIGKGKIPIVRTGDDPHNLPNILHVPGKNPAAFHRRNQTDQSVPRHKTVTGFETADGRARGGQTALAHQVKDKLDIGFLPAQRDARLAAREAEAELAHAGRTAEEGAGIAKPARYGSVFERGKTGERVRTRVRRPAGHRDVGLYRDAHALPTVAFLG